MPAKPNENSALLMRLIRKVFLEDWTMKLVALIITLGLWLGITGLRTTAVTTFSKIPLSIRVASEVEVTNSPVTEVVIKLSGDKTKINQINRDNLTVSIDLTDIQPGDRLVPINPDNVGIELPAGVKLDSVSPSKIPVRIEKTIERDVPVNVATEGDPASGFEVYASTAQPATVRVSGPESFIKPLDSVTTEKVSLDGRNADFSLRQVSLNVVSPRIRLLDTTVVDVSLRIGEQRIERTITMAVKTDKGERQASFRLKGPRSVLEALRADALRADYSKSESGEITLNLYLPNETVDTVQILERRLVGKP